MNSWKTVRLCELGEVWESVHGWYWFVTEYHEGSLAFGLVKGWELEWGYFDLAELRRLRKQCKVWRVPKKYWALCPCVVCDAASYSTVTDGPRVSEDSGFGGSPDRGSTERRSEKQWRKKTST